MASESAFKARAVDVQLLPADGLVMALTQLEDDHLDHGRRLQAAGVRSAIDLVQRTVLQTRANAQGKAEGNSAGMAARAGTRGPSLPGQAAGPP